MKIIDKIVNCKYYKYTHAWKNSGKRKHLAAVSTCLLVIRTPPQSTKNSLSVTGRPTATSHGHSLGCEAIHVKHGVSKLDELR